MPTQPLIGNLVPMVKRSVSGWTYRTIVIYFVLFMALILGGILMLAVRSHGL